MLSPKRIKFRKIQKGRLGGKATKGSEVSFGQFGLQALAPGRITAQQIESARVAMTRHIKRGGKIWIRIFRGALALARRDPHGQGQGRPGRVDRDGEARDGHVRDGGCDPGGDRKSVV